MVRRDHHKGCVWDRPGVYLQVDARVFAISLGISLLSALAFGMIPALQATRVNLNESFERFDSKRGWPMAIAAVAKCLGRRPDCARYGAARWLRLIVAQFSKRGIFPNGV